MIRECGKCEWWDNAHKRLEFFVPVEWMPNPGICRKKRPSTIVHENNLLGVQPFMDSVDYCGEFKEKDNGMPE